MAWQDSYDLPVCSVSRAEYGVCYQAAQTDRARRVNGATI